MGTSVWDPSQLGSAGHCTATVPAYSLNVTLVPISNHPVGYLTIWPAASSEPYSLDGRPSSNAAMVPGGTGDAVSVYVTLYQTS